MFEIGGYALSGVIAIAGLRKWRKILPIIKSARELVQKYDKVTGVESAGGRTITAEEWQSLTKEALDLVRDIVSWWSWRSQNK